MENLAQNFGVCAKFSSFRILRINGWIDLRLQGKTNVRWWRASLLLAVEGPADVGLARYNGELAHRVLVDAAKSRGRTRSTSRQTVGKCISTVCVSNKHDSILVAKHTCGLIAIEREEWRAIAEKLRSGEVSWKSFEKHRLENSPWMRIHQYWYYVNRLSPKESRSDRESIAAERERSVERSRQRSRPVAQNFVVEKQSVRLERGVVATM